MVNLSSLATEIINGRRLNRSDDLSFFCDCDLSELTKQADRIRAHFRGDKVNLCTIINAKSGQCGENCRFCAQSAHNHTSCAHYGFISSDKIISEAKANNKEGIKRVGLVTAGKALTGEEFEKAIDTYNLMRSEVNMEMCASMGFISKEQLEKLKASGVTHYHCNIETSRAYFPKICTTHTFDMKIEQIKKAQEEGLLVCSGGIIGMGEAMEDRIDMALTLSELKVESIPLNALNAIKGTPFEDITPLTQDEILRVVALFRFINPEADIRFAAGRKLLGENGRAAFESGCSAALTGNMLTTTGTTIKSDLALLASMNRQY